MLVRPVLVIVASAALSAGCAAQSTISAPRVPIPVLLGPVDRVGGHRGEGEALAPIAVEVEDFASASRDQHRVGNTVYRRTTATLAHEGEGKLSARILEATEAQHDRDVRVERLGTGAWVWITPDLTSMMRSAWFHVDAKVTKEQAR